MNAFGIHIDNLSVDEYIKSIIDAIKSGKRKLQMTGINIEQLALLEKDPSFASYCNASDWVNIDGTSVMVFLKMAGHGKSLERALCADIFLRLLDYANGNGESVYFLGTTQDAVETLVNNIRVSYPYINIVGYHNGYFRDDKQVVEEIKSLHPTFLFLGMPSPMKERFIYNNKDVMDVAFSYGVGGMFDILAGKARRAPEFWQKIGMEWLYRISQNPVDHTKRVFNSLLPSMRVAGKEIFRKRKRS